MSIKYEGKETLNKYCLYDIGDFSRPLIWKHNKQRLGVVHKDGAKYKNKDNQYLKMERLAWIYFNGDVPEGKRVLHRNKNKLDNRIDNLYIAGNEN